MADITEIFLSTVTEEKPMDIPPIVEVPPSEASTGEIVDISSEKNTSEEPALPALTIDEDSFALAVTECGGNVADAYRMVFGADTKMAFARGQSLLAQPNVAYRVRELQAVMKEQTLISIGTHLQELAVIRDLAKNQGQLKVALSAERTRGEVSGLYNHFEHGKQDKGPTNIQINFVSKYDNNI